MQLLYATTSVVYVSDTNNGIETLRNGFKFQPVPILSNFHVIANLIFPLLFPQSLWRLPTLQQVVAKAFKCVPITKFELHPVASPDQGKAGYIRQEVVQLLISGFLKFQSS